jgi:hypothetical protein
LFRRDPAGIVAAVPVRPSRSARATTRLTTLSRDDRGQASVETLGVLPFVFVLGAVVWQFALAGHTAWECAQAARAAARAEVVGEDGEEAARSALPDYLERGLEVERQSEGGARVSVTMPLLAPWWETSVPLSATASLGASP